MSDEQAIEAKERNVKRGISDTLFIQGTKISLKATHWDDGTLELSTDHLSRPSLQISFTLDPMSTAVLAELLDQEPGKR